MQETRVQTPLQEDPACRKAANSMHHNPLTCALSLETTTGKPHALEPTLHKREELPRWEAQPLLAATEKSLQSNEDPAQPI